jgi:transcriptional regulator with XRE-family HTH domain
METMKPHWTENSTADFVYRIASDFIMQLEKRLELQPMSQKELADKLNVTIGRVSQVFNNPGNLTLRNFVQYSRALGMKVAVVAYDDDDPQNQGGPVNSDIFTKCWERAGRPHDFFDLAASVRPVVQFAGGYVLTVRNMGELTFATAGPMPIEKNNSFVIQTRADTASKPETAATNERPLYA